MKTEEIGYVLKTENNIAYVRPSEPENCKKCSIKHYCKGGGISIRMKNEVGAIPGDSVLFEIDIDELNIRFILYVLLFLTVFLVGVVTGYEVGDKFSISREFSGVIGGFLFLILGGFFYKLFSSKKVSDEKIPKIKKIIKEDKG